MPRSSRGTAHLRAPSMLEAFQVARDLMALPVPLTPWNWLPTARELLRAVVLWGKPAQGPQSQTLTFQSAGRCSTPNSAPTPIAGL